MSWRELTRMRVFFNSHRLSWRIVQTREDSWRPSRRKWVGSNSTRMHESLDQTRVIVWTLKTSHPRLARALVYVYLFSHLFLIHNSFIHPSGRVAFGCEHFLQCVKLSISADTTGQHTQRQQDLVCWVRWRHAIPWNRPQAGQLHHGHYHSRSCCRGGLGWELHNFFWAFWWHMETV